MVVALGETIYAQDLAYHPTGALTSMEFGNELTETLTLNSRFRPDHLVSGPVDLTYGYQANGNVSAITDARSGYSASYSYDELDRLTSVTGFGATNFTYDVLGNRLKKHAGLTGEVTYEYSSTTNRLTSASTSLGAPEAGTFTYDNVGNMTGNDTGNGSWTHTYNSRNLMASATFGSATTTHTYT